MKAERFVLHGWSVRFPRGRTGQTFVSYDGGGPLGRSWFKTRKEARAYIREAASHALHGGRVVRARITFDVDQV